jgi:hypothetical protein
MKLRPEAAAEPDSGLEITELMWFEIDRMFKVICLSRKGIYKRFNLGERCFAVLSDGKIVTCFWAQFGVKQLDGLFLEFKIRPNQAWLYNAITIKSATREGLLSKYNSLYGQSLNGRRF